MKFEWNNINKEKPLCTQTGDWDGKKSDEIIVRDFKGNHYLVFCYQGFIDGSDFCDFYTSQNDYQIEGVLFWSLIPDVF